MDASLYSAMSAAKQFSLAQAVASNNIANANTSNFKSDNASFSALYLKSTDAIAVNAYTELNSLGVNLAPGAVNHTAISNDVYVGGNGYFSVVTADGDTAVMKSTSLQKTQAGLLVDSKGRAMVGVGGDPINVGLYPFSVNVDGSIMGGAAGDQSLGKLKVINLSADDVTKSVSGDIILSGEDAPKASNNNKVLTGYLEGSNVNSISEMTTLMLSQRDYELSTKMLSTIKGMHAASNKLVGE